MKTTKQLMQIIHSNEIMFEYNDLPEKRLGIYEHSSSGFLIILDSTLLEDEVLKKCSLAHELGHYYTLIGKNIPHDDDDHSMKLNKEKNEDKADRWACNYLIETSILIEFFSTRGYAKLEDLIDYFQVTEKLMMKKLNLMAVEKQYWHIRENRFLCLSNLPSMYVANLLDANLAKKAREL